MPATIRRMHLEPGPPARAPRSDALANREKLLAAAAAAIKARGMGVPMAEIAEQAGVGNGTLYRHFPTRERLLNALVQRSLDEILRRARAAAADDRPAIESIAGFFEQTIVHREELLILPLHGGPLLPDAHTDALRHEIRQALELVLARGRRDGSVRSDVTATDLIVTGAQLAQPLRNVPNWDGIARRQAELVLRGLAGTDPPPPPPSPQAGAE